MRSKITRKHVKVFLHTAQIRELQTKLLIPLVFSTFSRSNGLSLAVRDRRILYVSEPGLGTFFECSCCFFYFTLQVVRYFNGFWIFPDIFQTYSEEFYADLRKSNLIKICL